MTELGEYWFEDALDEPWAEALDEVSSPKGSSRLSMPGSRPGAWQWRREDLRPLVLGLSEADARRLSTLETSPAVRAFRLVRQQNVETEVIALCRDPEGQVALWARQMGALAILGPKDLAAISEKLAEARSRHALRAPCTSRPEPVPPAGIDTGRHAFVYGSRVMRELHQQLRTYAGSNHHIVIVGETGAGKEVLAREIHRLRHDEGDEEHPFIEQNCAYLSGDPLNQLVMLFGIPRNTIGNVYERVGWLTHARRGDLFLDEFELMDKAAQGGLLNAIESRRFSRVNDNGVLPFLGNVIVGVKKPLETLVAEKVLREDLVYRLKPVEVVLPPLRKRPEDIRVLAYHFLLTSKDGELGQGRRKLMVIEPHLMELFEEHSWPGNARELRNVIDLGLIHARPDEGSLQPSHLPGWKPRPFDASPTDSSDEEPLEVLKKLPTGSTYNLGKKLALLQMRWIDAAYSLTDGKESTARLLGYGYYNRLHRLLRRLCKTYREDAARLLNSELRAPFEGEEAGEPEDDD
ncbi:MAG: sigma-54-dependent Fis family transcriptional regulator [Candidatus Riflebacteria bacterium]|nr:sigma-54-dependent Fis family transcriptional regulator [Candidatus Riflebacteria bacterium]